MVRRRGWSRGHAWIEPNVDTIRERKLRANTFFVMKYYILNTGYMIIAGLDSPPPQAGGADRL